MNERPTILFLPKWYPNHFDPQNGIFVQKHAIAISSFADVVVLFLCPSIDSSIKGIKKENPYPGITEYTFYYTSDTNSNIVIKTIQLIRYTYSLFKCLKVIRKNHKKIQITHAHIMLRTGVISLILKFFRKIPYIITEHWHGYLTGSFAQKNPVIKKITKIIVREAFAVTTVSDVLAEGMKKNKLYNKKYITIPNVIDFETAKPIQNNTDEIIILCVSDLEDKNKNISGIIKAFSAVKDKISNAVLHIIGGGSDEEKLKKLVKDLELDPIVVFYGRQPNDFAISKIQQCSFVVINSYIETFSVVSAEALACGKPIVATRCKGPESFLDETSTIWITPGNNDELKDALVKMSTNYTNYCPEKLQQIAKEKFSKEVVSLAFKNLYSDIVNLK